MSGFKDIDLSRLPPPDVVEALDYETILQELIDDFLARYPEYSMADLESDMAMKLLETGAYREFGLRGRVNDASRAVMLASAGGGDLDHLAALYAVERLIVDPGDPEAVPPIEPVLESDEAFRRRVQLAPEAMTTAGSRGSYLFHVLSFPGVRDAEIYSPKGGEVLASVLGEDGDGRIDEAMAAEITATLNADHIRPLNDTPRAESADIREWRVTARLELYDGPDADTVLAEARARFDAFAAERHRIGETITQSGIDAALQVSGVRAVHLDGWEDIPGAESVAPYCVGITLSRVAA